MTPGSIALIAAAVVSIAGLGIDVVITVFHPHGHGGPVTRTLNRGLWSVLQAITSRIDASRRSRVLSFCGPALAPITIIAWELWLILGFASMYSLPGALARGGVAGSPHTSALDPLYYSGYVATTLGLGDVIAIGPWVRLATITESLLGFALLAIVVTYVLAIYRELLAAHTLALELSAIGNVGSEGRGDEDHVLDGWDRETARALIRSVEAHGQYPILHYFRPMDPERSLILQVARIVPEVFGGPAARTDAGKLAQFAVRRFVTELNGCVPARFQPVPSTLGADASGAELAMTNRLLAYLGYPPIAP